MTIAINRFAKAGIFGISTGRGFPDVWHRQLRERPSITAAAGRVQTTGRARDLFASAIYPQMIARCITSRNCSHCRGEHSQASPVAITQTMVFFTLWTPKRNEPRHQPHLLERALTASGMSPWCGATGGMSG
jgi:hypothetical protein